MKIWIEIESCNKCPHFKSSPYPTMDSWERAEYWWCKADDAVAPNEDAEKHRLSVRVDKLRYIAGYVEWTDKTPIPEWCPAKIKE